MQTIPMEKRILKIKGCLQASPEVDHDRDFVARVPNDVPLESKLEACQKYQEELRYDTTVEDVPIQPSKDSEVHDHDSTEDSIGNREEVPHILMSEYATCSWNLRPQNGQQPTVGIFASDIR